jgi:hypothetical protein
MEKVGLGGVMVVGEQCTPGGAGEAEGGAPTADGQHEGGLMNGGYTSIIVCAFARCLGRAGA